MLDIYFSIHLLLLFIVKLYFFSVFIRFETQGFENSEKWVHANICFFVWYLNFACKVIWLWLLLVSKWEMFYLVSKSHTLILSIKFFDKWGCKFGVVCQWNNNNLWYWVSVSCPDHGPTRHDNRYDDSEEGHSAT